MKDNKKMFYFFVGCVCLALVIIGATYAYFTASARDESINGKTDTSRIALAVERVTTLDLVEGLIPMKNNQAPNAALGKCVDDRGYAGCQIYRITVNVEGSDEISLDGFVTVNNNDGVETRFSRVFTDDKENSFYTEYTNDDMLNDDFDYDYYIKNGISTKTDNTKLNSNDDYNCLFVRNEIFDVDNTKGVYYLMIWVYDNLENQNQLQGMKDAFSGSVIFMTSYGNEIKATFN